MPRDDDVPAQWSCTCTGTAFNQTLAGSNISTQLEPDLLAAVPVRQMAQLAVQGLARSLHIGNILHVALVS
jgi:hypothetical protein